MQTTIARTTMNAKILERLYPLPNPLRTLEEWEQAHHRDLPTLSDDDLLRDLRCARRRLDYEDDKTAQVWLSERIIRIRQEVASRRAPEPRKPTPRRPRLEVRE